MMESELRLIQADALKAKLAQYQRNASYASEFLNAGHLNLDNLQKLNQRAQEISRVAGSQINKSAAETYGHEIEQLVEEALNRINARHRGRSLFGGTEYKANFGNTKVQVGHEAKKTISLKNTLVGDAGLSGDRELKVAESVVFQINGREYVVQATVDGLSTSTVTEIAKVLLMVIKVCYLIHPHCPILPSLIQAMRHLSELRHRRTTTVTHLHNCTLRFYIRRP